MPRFSEKRFSSFELWTLKQNSKMSPQVGLTVSWQTSEETKRDRDMWHTHTHTHTQETCTSLLWVAISDWRRKLQVQGRWGEGARIWQHILHANRTQTGLVPETPYIDTKYSMHSGKEEHSYRTLIECLRTGHFQASLLLDTILCVPAVIGGMAVWRYNQKTKKIDCTDTRCGGSMRPTFLHYVTIYFFGLIANPLPLPLPCFTRDNFLLFLFIINENTCVCVALFY